MSAKANFGVAPRLASLLGENYRSTYQAIRELVDNAWDADAETVWITLPEPFSQQPITVEDDGSGMTKAELEKEYLLIAYDRRSRRGERTIKHDRPVRGHRGIGKFAGLAVAERMRIETRSGGSLSSVEITKSALLASKKDLERIDLPLAVVPCGDQEHGTRIILSELNTRISLPTAEDLRGPLALEFGGFARFSIWIDGQLLTREAIQGKTITRTTNLPGVGPVTLRITVMDNPRGAKQAGIVTRVGTKIVGKPSLLGADDDEEIPRKLFKRVVGEIEADGLEGDVTSDSGALFEDGKFCKDVQNWAQEQVAEVVREEFARQVNLAKARQQKKINERLAKLPEFRRPFAEKAIEKAMGRFYPDSEEKFDLLTFIVLEAFEKTEYWTVCLKIEEARHTGIIALADALQEFGLADLAYMGEQARRRIQFLDEVDGLAGDESTLESTMHRSLETNLWVFGPEYTLMASNKTLARTIKEYVSEKFAGPSASKRPDLLLAQSVLNRYLLIEFKRPSHTIVRDDENQAEKYRDDLTPRFGTIDILVIGGKRSRTIQAQYDRGDITLTTYGAIFSTARTQLDWLLRQLTVPT